MQYMMYVCSAMQYIMPIIIISLRFGNKIFEDSIFSATMVKLFETTIQFESFPYYIPVSGRPS